jgi:hypothetical protein
MTSNPLAMFYFILSVGLYLGKDFLERIRMKNIKTLKKRSLRYL